jgi:hypothetical protein
MNRHFINLLGKRHGVTGLWALFLVVCTYGAVLSAQAASFEAKSKTLDGGAESCLPPNGAIDPGETNTVTFLFKNTSGGNALTDVKVKLNSADSTSTAGGVDFSLTGEVAIAGSVANNAEFTATFRFRASGVCGTTLRPTFTINGKQDGNSFAAVTSLTNAGNFDFQLGLTIETTYTFSNTSAITIRDFNTGSPYPSTITPSGVPNVSDTTGERVKRVAVKLNGVTHSNAKDINVMLIGPDNQSVVLMREAGGINSATAPINGADLTFVESASGKLPSSAQIATGSFKPSDYSSGNFVTPSGSGTASDLGAATHSNLNTAFADRSANTQWKLYIFDDSPGDSGTVAGGWALTLTTTKVVCCGVGETFPFVAEGANPDRKAGISNKTGGSGFNEDFTNADIPFKANDIESGGGGLSYAATSSNQSIIQNSQFEFSGSGADRNLRIKKPVDNAFGTVAITVTVTDGSAKSNSTTFDFEVKSVNDSPTFQSSVRNQSLNKGSRTPELAFTIADVETDPANLIVTATATDTGRSAPMSGTSNTIVPNANIFLGGSGANRTITVVPAQEGSGGTDGQSTVTVRVLDASGAVATTSFVVEFEANRDEPTVSPVSAVSMDEDTVKKIPFTVRTAASPANGAQTTADGLTITRSISSTPTDLFASVTFEGSGAERNIVLTPAANKSGTASITITVSDGQKQRSAAAFSVTVVEINDRPTIGVSATQVTIPEDSNTAEIEFTIGDIETSDLNAFVVGANTGKRISVEVQPSGSTLVPASLVNDNNTAGLKLGGTGAKRTIRVKPAADQFGKATIILTINDNTGGDTATASASFLVNVDAVNDAPVLGKVRRNGRDGAVGSGIAAVSPGTTGWPLDASGDAAEKDLVDDAANAILVVDEDAPGLDSDGNPREAQLIISGIRAGPAGTGAQEFDQSVALTMSRDDANGVILSASFDPDTTTESQGGPTSSTKLKLKLNKNKSGDVNFTITATDSAGASTSKKFRLRVNSVNDSPTFTGSGSGGAIPDQSIGQGQTVVIPITVSDIETSVANMVVVTKTSSAQTAVSNNNIVWDPNRSRVTITSNADAAIDATATITLKFRDRGKDDSESGSGGTTIETAERQFRVTVINIPINNAPSMDLSRSSQTIQEDAVATLTLTITDIEEAGTFTGTLSATSSDATLVPAGNILFGGTGTNRTVVIIPAADKSGSATITLTATDIGVTVPGTGAGTGAGQNKLSVVKTFALTVIPVEDLPTISFKSGNGGPFFTDEDTAVADSRNSGSNLIEINVSDAETPSDQLTISKTSSNTGVIPNDNIVVEGTGTTRTVRITPAANRNTYSLSDGTSTPVQVTLKVKDSANQEVTLPAFDVFVRAKNDTPTLTKPGDLTINEDAGTQTVTLTGITAGGGESGPVNGNALTLSLTAQAVNTGTDTANTSLLTGALTITPSTITVTDGSATFTAALTFSPDADKFGDAEIKVTVTDGASNAAVSQTGGSNGSGSSASLTTATDSKSVTQRFKVTVNSVNDAPTINPIQDITIQQNASSSIIPITIDDKETPGVNLQVALSSSNTSLVPNNTTDSSQAGMQPTGSANNRGVVIKPISGASGTTDITVTVTDQATGGAAAVSSSRVFRVTVVAGQKPIISTIPNQTLSANSFSDIIAFTVNDAQTAAGSLSVSGVSLNTSIIPNANIQFGPIDTANPSRRTMIIKTEATPGTADIRITVGDSDGNDEKVTFTVTVRGEAPTITVVPDQTIAKSGNTGPIPFTVADKETFPGFLRVEGRSSNQVFVPNSNVVIGGSGGNRTVTVTGVADQEGSTTITLTVTDNEGQTATRNFIVKTPDPKNDAPTISSISNQTTDVGVPSQVLVFSVGDDQTAVGSLTVTATSSNKTLVPDANVFLGGSGASRTVFVQPAAGLVGTTTITVTVTDNGPGAAKSASTSFTVTVSANENPTISTIPSQTTERNRVTSSVSFTVGDKETAAASLTVAGASSDASIVAVSGIELGGSGVNRTVVVKPVANAVGSASITLTVTDGGGKTASTSFRLTVTQPPPVKGDFDGDGQSDLLFQDNDGFLAVWLMNGTSVSSAGFTLPSNVGDAAFRVATSGDFNRDGSDDIIFQHTDGTLAIWFMNGTFQDSAALLNPSNPGDRRWRVVGSADLNRDGKLDLVFQHTDGTLAVWYMDGTSLSSAALLSPASPGDSKWRVVAVGDLTGDGREDLVFQYSDGTLALWAMNGTTLTTASLLSPSNPGAGWRVAGSGKVSKAFSVSLTGAAERPNAVTTTATGSGKLTVVGNQLSFNITYSGLSGVATGAHIHLPASTEQTAGVSINLQAFNGGAFGTAGSLVGTVTLTADQLAGIVGGQAYVNIHTAANGGGEIRGQIAPDASAASKVDLIFQSATRDLAIWFMDGTKLSSAQLVTPSNSGGTWTLVAPK